MRYQIPQMFEAGAAKCAIVNMASIHGTVAAWSMEVIPPSDRLLRDAARRTAAPLPPWPVLCTGSAGMRRIHRFFLWARRPNLRAQWAPDEESGTRGALRGDPRAGPHRHMTVNRVLQIKNAATTSLHFTRVDVHYFVGTGHPPSGHPKEFAGATAPQVSIKMRTSALTLHPSGLSSKCLSSCGGIRAGG